MIAIDQPTVTLIAAGVAAAAALLSLGIQLQGARRAEMRSAHRLALAPFLEVLGESIHEVMSFSVLIRKRALEDKGVENSISNAQRAAKDLKRVRRRVRYTLAGLDEPLRVLDRFPDWVALQRDLDGDGADRLIAAGQALQKGIDKAIRRSYLRGLPPGALQGWRLRRQADRVRSIHNNRYSQLPPRAEDLTQSCELR